TSRSALLAYTTLFRSDAEAVLLGIEVLRQYAGNQVGEVGRLADVRLLAHHLGEKFVGDPLAGEYQVNILRHGLHRLAIALRGVRPQRLGQEDDAGAVLLPGLGRLRQLAARPFAPLVAVGETGGVDHHVDFTVEDHAVHFPQRAWCQVGQVAPLDAVAPERGL